MLVIFIFFLDDFQIQSYVSALHKNIKQLLNLKCPHIHPYKNFTYINATVLDKIRIQITLSPKVNVFFTDAESESSGKLLRQDYKSNPHV